MKFAASAPLSVISLLGALANAAPVPEPDTDILAARDGTKVAEPMQSGKSASEISISNGSGKPGITISNGAITEKPAEKGAVTPGQFSASKKGGERILVCHEQESEEKPKDEKPKDEKSADKSKKPESKTKEHKREESKPKEKGEKILVCREKEMPPGFEAEKRPTETVKPEEKKPAEAAKVQDKVPVPSKTSH